MKWNIISGNKESFTGAPEWASKKVIIDGDLMWWDGVSKFEPIHGPIVSCQFEYEEEFKVIAEREII
ncbi:hypothetical protein [Yersinia sp. 2105 StPb PI]|uniref:hypothetical protein n=1 Tax=Yersinia sp. 2105 StPb PI TaxID=2507058 RepID=UPI000FFB9D6B|nr:hypothetical protein [Yersinia sp. 2105 StPb PI]RXA93760.1 hypothetical protein EQP49_22465 [Yersinia sp. 2105 StPb PI]